MKRGFTLIELIVSIGIFSLILSFSFASIRGAQIQNRDAKRIADLQTLQSALEQHLLGDPSRDYPPDPQISTASNSAYCTKYTTAGTEKGLYDNRCFREYLAGGVMPYDPKGNEYPYSKPGCFRDSSAPGGVLLANNGVCNLVQGAYGLHIVLESINRPEASNDATPTKSQSYDLVP